MEGLIAKFVVIFLWGILLGGITGFVCGALLVFAEFRDFASQDDQKKKEDAEDARKKK